MEQCVQLTECTACTLPNRVRATIEARLLIGHSHLERCRGNFCPHLHPPPNPDTLVKSHSLCHNTISNLHYEYIRYDTIVEFNVDSKAERSA